MSMMMVSFSAAGIQIANILDVNVNLVNMCMGVYIFASVFSIPGNYVNDKYGFHIGVSHCLIRFSFTLQCYYFWSVRGSVYL